MSVMRWLSAFRGLDPFACHRSSLGPLPSGPRVKPFPPDKSSKGFLECIHRTLYTIQCTHAWESHCSLYASASPYSGLAGGCVLARRLSNSHLALHPHLHDALRHRPRGSYRCGIGPGHAADCASIGLLSPTSTHTGRDHLSRRTSGFK